MIANIAKLKDCGIFRDYNQAQCEDFLKYNIFYGWNGSGKSTLAKIFCSLEKKQMPVGFEKAQFEVCLKNSQVLNPSNLVDFPYKLFAFNQDFIKENISWDETVKSILFVSEEKIEERRKLESLKVQRKQVQDSSVKMNGKIQKYVGEQNKFLTHTAKMIKENFRMLDLADKNYVNYSRPKLESYIEKNNKQLREIECKLSEVEVKKITDSIKPEKKDKVAIAIKPIQFNRYDGIRSRILALLTTIIVSNSIERLKNNPEIANWVEEGLGIHKKGDITDCEFCGNVISEIRLNELENHFNANFKELKLKLNTAREWLQTNVMLIPDSLPDKSGFYDEFLSEYASLAEGFVDACTRINSIVENWISAIEGKLQNPFEKTWSVEKIDEQLINKYNEFTEKLVALEKRHNDKSNDFENEIKKAKMIMEKHYCYEELIEFDYFGKIEAFKQMEKDKKIIMDMETKLTADISGLEKILLNEVLGASEFNNHLSKFLGHREIYLEFDEVEKGYKITRGLAKKRAFNLSEGEKTAIAFVYFITKLKEHGNKLGDSIVLIDDPVSSFDSNHLHHAYSFLKCECENPLQLFIFTHNFLYFKLVRDWLYKKNKKDAIKTRIYAIEVIPGEMRKAEIKNADATLIDYQSEYHYLFKKVYSYREQSKLSLDDAFLVANLARRLLEGFLSFKFPKQRNDFFQLMDEAIKDNTKREKIYRFINKYSHNRTVDIGDNSVDNILCESSNVVKEILCVLEELDKTHFEEMKELICNL